MHNFLKSESGAVTVDWVVLTAGLVGVGLVVGNTLTPVIQASIDAVGDDICTTIDATSTGYTATGGTSGGGTC